MRIWIVFLAGISIAAGASAREIQLTVYNNDLGLVRDVRDLDLQSGRGSVSIVDVAAQIDPTSVHLKSLTREGGITVLEQNYRYDLASPERILERYLDSAIEAVLEGGELHQGKLLSFTGDQLVLSGDKGLSILRRDKLIDLRCPSLPEGLITKPTLVWDIQADRGGSQKAELSYLTNGIAWHAEYVAVSNEDDTAADLAAWVSVDNHSGADYPDAKLQLIAGDVNRVRPEEPHYRGGRNLEVMAMAKADVGFEEEAFFEYHLYTLPRPTTVRDRETKQIALFPPARTPVKKLYEYKPWQDEKKIRIVLEFENREERGLGMPLPAGKVRTYKQDSHGGQQFVGEDMIDHTPKNEKVRLGLGNAFDVVAERTVKDQTRISDRVFEQSVEVKFRNRKTEPITIVAQDRFWGDWKFTTESFVSTKKDARTAEWSIPVGPDAEVVLTYTVRITT
jgi:hypothetical protein